MNSPKSILISAFVTCFVAPAVAEVNDQYAPFLYDPNDPTVALLYGEIDARTPLAFSRLMEAVPSVEAVLLASPGGNVYAAASIARDIDRLGLKTMVPEGEACFSACSFVYFSGHERYVEGQLGVHQVSSLDPNLEAAQVAVSDMYEMLADFGVPNDVFLLMLRTPPEEMRVLTPTELNKWGLVGVRASADQGNLGASQKLAEPASNDALQSTLLRDGTYESGNLSLIVEGGLAGVTYVGDGCLGSFDGRISEKDAGIFIDGEDCSIAVKVLGPFDLSLEQGPGCSMYHGVACSLSGYVRRSQ